MILLAHLAYQNEPIYLPVVVVGMMLSPRMALFLRNFNPSVFNYYINNGNV